jgi:SHS2 domain-containing protein
VRLAAGRSNLYFRLYSESRAPGTLWGVEGTASRSQGKAPTRPGGTGHRQLPHPADCLLEAWGPDRASCLTETLLALVETFAEVRDPAATEVLPLAASETGAEDALVSLLEEVIYVVDALGVVPVRFHLAEAEDGGLTGDMEVVPASQVHLVGPVPKAVSYHALQAAPTEGGWQCRVLVDV